MPIHTVALGTAGGTITDSSGAPPRTAGPGDDGARSRPPPEARASTWTDADQLDAVYERLGSQIATRPEQREITAGFAAGGMALLLAAAGSR